MLKLTRWFPLTRNGAPIDYEPPDQRIYDMTAPNFPPDAEEYGVFETNAWIEASRSYVNSLRLAAISNRLVIEPYLAPVALLASGCVLTKGSVRILDLGGGIGPCVDPILSALRPEDDVSYVVVDGEQNCEVGRKLFAHDKRVTFLPKTPAGTFDIILMSGSLQYIQDWRGALAHAASLKPDHVYIARLPLRPDRTIAVRQCIRLGAPPALAGKVWKWVLNPTELDAFMDGFGYRKTIDLYTRDLTAELNGAGDLGPADIRVRSYRREERMVTTPR